MSLSLTTIQHNNCNEIQLEGSALTEEDFVELHELVDSHTEQQPNIILNLKNIKILNSLGINTLIKIFTKSRNSGGDMYIVNISEKINQLLLLTKLNTVLNIATSIQDAMDNFE